jgi:hypothetical protein
VTRERLTFANVISVIALFVALGGGAYAISKAPKNSVTSKSIKNGQVKTKDLGKDAATGAKVNEASLGQVPSAVNAGHAQTADLAARADVGAQRFQSFNMPSTDPSIVQSTVPAHVLLTFGEAKIAASCFKVGPGIEVYLSVIATSPGTLYGFYHTDSADDGTTNTTTQRKVQLAAGNAYAINDGFSSPASPNPTDGDGQAIFSGAERSLVIASHVDAGLTADRCNVAGTVVQAAP